MKPVTAVVVAHQNNDELTECLRSLIAQDIAEIVLVANHPDDDHDRCWVAAGGVNSSTVWQRISFHTNDGFSGGCRRGVSASSQPWVLLINPDAVLQPGAVEILLSAADEQQHPLVGPQIMLPDGTVNAGDNPVHQLGLSWSGNLYGPAESGPVREVLSCSGCCFLVNKNWWYQLGGFWPSFELYCEDTDLCWRSAIAGHPALFIPDAQVIHYYDFQSDNQQKWFWLERNRWQMLLANNERATLLRLLPALLLFELAVIALAIKSGWWREKCRSYQSLWQSRQQIRYHRRQVQARRQVTDQQLLPMFTDVFNSRAMDTGSQTILNRLLQPLLLKQRGPK